MVPMQRIASLRKKHTDLDMQVQAESARPMPDPHLLRRLKAEKLSLKDMIDILLSEEQAAA